MPNKHIVYKWSCDWCSLMFDARVKCAQHENTQHPKNTNDGATDQQMTMAHLLGRLFAINDNANELIVAVELYEQMRAQFDKDASSVNDLHSSTGTTSRARKKRHALVAGENDNKQRNVQANVDTMIIDQNAKQNAGNELDFHEFSQRFSENREFLADAENMEKENAFCKLPTNDDSYSYDANLNMYLQTNQHSNDTRRSSKISTEQKLKFLRHVEIYKHLLFGKQSSRLTNDMKQEQWVKIYSWCVDQQMPFVLAAQMQTRMPAWKFIRDSVMGNYCQQLKAKLDKFRLTGVDRATIDNSLNMAEQCLLEIFGDRLGHVECID